MKRPFAVIGLSYLFALVVALACGERWSFYLALALLPAFVVSLFVRPLRKQKTVPVALLSACIAFAAFFAANTAIVKPVKVLEGQTAFVVGTIADIPYEQYGRYYYTIETTQIAYEGAPQQIRFMLSLNSPVEANFFDNISCNVRFRQVYEPAQDYYAAKGMFVSGSAQEGDVQVTENPDKPLYYYALYARQAIAQAVRDIIPVQQASLTNALLLGDKQGLDQDVKTQFNITGAGHLIVVSGLHMSVIANFLYMFFYRLLKRDRPACIAAISGIFVFMAITGFTPSVMRAGIMLLIYMAGKLFHKQADSLNSLGLAALLLTVFNPLAAGDVGMLLSFGATLGIILLYPPSERWLHAKLKHVRFGVAPLRFVGTTLLVSLCATVMTMPIMLLSFGTFSLYFLLANLLLVWAAQLVLILALPMALLSFCGIFSFLAYPFAFVVTALCSYMLFVSELLAGLPYAQVNIDRPYIWLWMSATLIMVAIAVLMKRGWKPVRVTALLSLAVLLCGILTDTLFHMHTVTLKIQDTGDGASVVLESTSSRAVLSCGGSSDQETLLQYLEDNPKPTDLLIVASGKRSTRYAKELAEQFDVQNILLYDTNGNEELEKALAESENEVTLFQGQQQIQLWENIKIELLPQNGCVWIYLQTQDKDVLLCPDGGRLQDVPAAWRSADLCVLSVLPEDYYLLRSGGLVISNTVEKSTAQAYMVAPYIQYIAATPNNGVEIMLAR